MGGILFLNQSGPAREGVNESLRHVIRRKVYLLVAVLLLWVPTPEAWSSGVSPFCKFSVKKGVLEPGAQYDIAKAYQAADLVVFGETGDRKSEGNTIFHVKQIIKGTSPSTIQLVGLQCQGTACTGLSVAAHHSYLMLLRQVSPGLFHKVDGDGNDVCPNIFSVEQDEVMVGARAITLREVRQFFESHPESIPLR